MSEPLLPVAEALAQLTSMVAPVSGRETLATTAALDRVVATDLRAPTPIPNFDHSAMDGYAVASQDPAFQAENPSLRVTGTAFAGRPATAQVAPGSAVRIFTGAVMPAGADAVIIQENVVTDGNAARPSHRPEPGEWVRYAGHDLQQGAVIVSAGTRLAAQHIGLLTSAGLTELPVVARPRVAVFSNGDELIAPGEPLAPGQIYDSNRITLSAALTALPVEVIDLGRVPDEADALAATLDAAVEQHADLILTSGGVSVGDADHVKAVLAQRGETAFWRVAIKPGKPFLFGRVNSSWFMGLPGNPVSTFVTFHVLVKPAILRLAGARATPLTRFRVPLSHDIARTPGREDWQRGVLATAANGAVTVSNTGNQSSGILSSVCAADCFIVIERDRGSLAAGDWVDVVPFGGALS